MQLRDRPAEPWFSFLRELDGSIECSIQLHCLGGFVVSQIYGLVRETADLDVLTVIPRPVAEPILKLCRKQSNLHKKHGVYVDHVRVANFPADYETRLTRVFPFFDKLELLALEPHDLALTKLERSNDKDIQDVVYLAQAGLIVRGTLLERFESEFEPYVVGRSPTWNRTTLQMWIDACWPKI